MILRKIITVVATRCHILTRKCTKFDFGWGCAPDPTAGSYSTPLDLARFKGVTLKGHKGGTEKVRMGRGRKGE